MQRWLSLALALCFALFAPYAQADNEKKPAERKEKETKTSTKKPAKRAKAVVKKAIKKAEKKAEKKADKKKPKPRVAKPKLPDTPPPAFGFFDEKAKGKKGKRKSPTYHLTIRLSGATIKITYARPYKKKRKLFGGLVPFGKVWRTGANEATTLTTDQALKIGNKVLKPGTYALFTIPGKKSWTIIFNSVAKQWGAYKYNSKKDVLRIKAKVEKTSATEQFTIAASHVPPAKGGISLSWGKTQVQFPFVVLYKKKK